VIDDLRLPQCDSPTNPIGNDNPDDGLVGLSYHDSRNNEIVLPPMSVQQKNQPEGWLF